MSQSSPAVSVVFPVYNESGSLRPLVEQLMRVLRGIGRPYEIIAVDDGSSDGSYGILKELRQSESALRPIRFRYNAGQTAALSAGIAAATGDIIVTIDSDLENDPADIPRLIAKLEEGYDVVSGWRQGRWEGAWLTRRLPSVAANRLISKFSGVPLHDYGCTLKAYRAEAIKSIRLYGDMHRFIPAYAAWRGGKVTEIPVNHKPRMYGVSKYGFGRMPRVLLDLVVLVFLHRYMNRPMHFFGGWGLASLFSGFTAAALAVVLKVTGIRDFVATPLPILATLLIIVGVQLVLFGVIAEMLMRTYYESQDKHPYTVEESA